MLKVLRVVLVTVAGAAALVACGPGNEPIVVNSAGDAADASVDGTCATSTGACTLRAALAEARNRDGADTVTFAIPGGGTQTIQLTSTLPAVDDDDPTTIDGYTQPGSSPNTNARTSNAVLRVQIRGTGVSGVDGLLVQSAGNVVRGLSFYDFRESVLIQGANASGNVVAGNFVGTNAAATFAHPSIVQNASGVSVGAGAHDNRIGGTAVADRNVLSGNAHSGVAFNGLGTSANVVQGNLVGLAPSGNAKVPNGFGIDVNRGASGNLIGGSGSGEGNVVSGNRGLGVELSHETTTTGNQVVGNFIGTNVTGTAVAEHTKNGTVGVKLEDRVQGNQVLGNVIGGNRTYGIHITSSSADNTIAGNWIGITSAGVNIANGGATGGVGQGPGVFLDRSANGNVIGPANVIGRNLAGGVALGSDAGIGNTITQSETTGNTGMGIDISPRPESNPNDVGDVDTGPNNRLNYPVLTSARSSAVIGTACGGCRVELYEASTDPTGHGEGKRYLGATTAAGDGSFTYSPGVSAGTSVTATATDADGSTSELAANRTAT